MDNYTMSDVTLEQLQLVDGSWDWKQAGEGCLAGAEVGAMLAFFVFPISTFAGAVSGCLHGAVIGGLNL
jgi:hypothetical protein